VLHLLVPTTPRGLRLPIDFFFRSLAADQQENSVGVVLSGMGSDGTLGLRAIKEIGGLVLVQDPATAKFDSMPLSAIDAGLADFSAAPDELPAKLVAYRRHLPQISKAALALPEKVLGALEKIVILLRSHSGQDFTLYRRNTLHRRVERRMGIHQLAKIDAYVRYLQENPQELGILYKELLIGVTNFFRDPLAWKQLTKHALPALIKGMHPGGTLRAWVAGCSTGEEAYTLAMAFDETLQRLKAEGTLSLQIYATDLDKDAIDKARRGCFPESITSEVSPARLTRFFVKEPAGYRVNKHIRSMVIFAPQNLIMDPPFTKLDIVSCRNLLIYLTPELQRKIFPLFHYSLNRGGILFLGSAESIGSFGNLFSPLAQKERIFRRNEIATSGLHLDFPAVYVPVSTTHSVAPQPSPRSLQSLADQFLQTRFVPPAVLVNSLGDILYINGRTGKYLEPAAGKANWNVIAMAREGLRYDLSNALQKACRKKSPVIVCGIKTGSQDEARFVDLLVEALDEPKELRGMVLIVFSDTATPVKTGAPTKSRVSTVQHRNVELELRRAHEELQSGREEMQTTQEELKSMNEELQSTNEELQSSNEELTTSKEEMQSLNEELQTVNAELQTKLDELSCANNDMKNLLNSTEIATVFLDNELRVRRFTAQAKTIIKFIPSDVGRPITDLASDLLYPTLIEDAHEVLRTLVFSERAIKTVDGRWFTVRVMPYRTMDNRIDGVVITYADITAAKKLEAKLRESNSDLTTRSARQGRALDRAEERLDSRDGKLTRQKKKPKATRKATGSAGKPKL
jgi:two-component system CheB/CheR fusion protein